MDAHSGAAEAHAEAMGAHSSAEEAHFGVMKDYPGAKNAHSGKVENHLEQWKIIWSSGEPFGTVDTHSGAEEAHSGAVEANSGAVEVFIEPRRLIIYVAVEDHLEPVL